MGASPTRPRSGARTAPGRLAPGVLLLALVLAGCGDRKPPPDADGDLLEDQAELDGWVIHIDLLGRREQRHVTSDPRMQDTDGDGVLDVHEFALGSDPRDRDTDDDGLTDCQEAQHRNRTECEDPFWEGQTDGGYKTMANNADSDPGRGRYVNQVLRFEDPTGTVQRPVPWGDGIPDGEELMGYWVDLPFGGRSWTVSDPKRLDSDGDLLEDGEERFLYGSDPQNPDSDGDGCRDGLDPWPDRGHTYAANFTVAWNGTGAASVRLSLSLAGQVVTVPREGALAIEGGTPLHVGSGPIEATDCQWPPHAPWMLVEAVAILEQDGRTRILDLHSHTLGIARMTAEWNVRDQAFRGLMPAPMQGTLRVAGPDGTLDLQPQAIPQGT